MIYSFPCWDKEYSLVRIGREEHTTIYASSVIYYVLCELAKMESRPSPKISAAEESLSVRAEGQQYNMKPGLETES